MNPQPNSLFWIQSALAVAAAALGAVTTVWRDWIEWILGVDPDRHSGSVEWLVVGALLFSALALALLARKEWRRTRPISGGTPEAG